MVGGAENVRVSRHVGCGECSTPNDREPTGILCEVRVSLLLGPVAAVDAFPPVRAVR